MGALEIRNKKLRCINCLDIRRLLIVPGYPDPKIEIMCHCNKSEESLLEYCSELKKITNFKLTCQKCGKEEIKHPRFCYECLAVYCSKCCNSHLPRITGDEDAFKRASLSGHKTIHVEKLDFFCVNHQSENFIGYCQQCLMNICSQCIKEKTHQYHQVELYSVIKMDKQSKDDFKKGIKKAEKKIEKNNKLIKTFCKKNKKNINVKEIEEEFKVISEENDYILELMKYCYNLYDHSKNKNYSIIYNLIKNSKLNLKRLKFEKDQSTEEKADDILKYLKKDIFILYKRNKTNIEEFEVDNEQEQDEEEDEVDDDAYNVSQSKTQNFISRKMSDPSHEETNNNNEANEVSNTAPDNYLNAEEEQVNNEQEEENNNVAVLQANTAPKPRPEMKKVRMPPMFNQPPEGKKPANIPPPKKLKMPLMFEKKEEEKKPANIPPPKKLKMPLMLEKKEEDKPKERAAIIKIESSGNMGDRKNMLAQMMANKGVMGGKPKIPSPTESNQPAEEKIEIVHESNEGQTEEVLNKVVVTNKKKKKPRKANFFVEGQENPEKPKPPPAPVENNENNNNDNAQANNQESQDQTQPEQTTQQEQTTETQEEEKKDNE